MKKYIKPEIEILELRLEERIANCNFGPIPEELDSPGREGMQIRPLIGPLLEES